MEAARRLAESAPKEYAGWNELAQALIDQANATANPALLPEAERAIAQSVAIAASGTDVRRLQLQFLLAQKKYAEVVIKATALNNAVPDDLLGYGYLADAQMALGRVADAEANVQWMLDLRRSDPASLKRAGQFRLLIKDPEGAAQMLEAAYQRLQPEEFAERAWVLAQLARAYAGLGQRAQAIQTLEAILKDVPDYAEAQTLLARLRPARTTPAQARMARP